MLTYHKPIAAFPHNSRHRFVPQLPGASVLLTLRFIKFGFVGVSGIAVNLGALYIFKNYIFNRIDLNVLSLDIATNLSMLCAILLSILNNFSFNKLWTWSDRELPNFSEVGLIKKLFAKYFLASMMSLVLQITFSNIFIKFGLNYLIASLMSIAIGATFNFISNNKYTFKE